MTNPGITEIIPSKAKAWVALFGSLLTFAAPFILETADALPSPWPAVVGAVFAVLTALGVFKAPYKPTPDAVLVHEDAVEGPVVPAATPDNPVGRFRNPWK